MVDRVALRGDYMEARDKKLILELICERQINMIIKDHTSYDSDEYKYLEALKVRIKDM